jgi:hypothetical protein
MSHKPLDELEMYELLHAAYPELFADDDDNAFDAAQEFADKLIGWDAIADLLGRVAMLTTPMQSARGGRVMHSLVKVLAVNDGVAKTRALVKREANP